MEESAVSNEVSIAQKRNKYYVNVYYKYILVDRYCNNVKCKQK